MTFHYSQTVHCYSYQLLILLILDTGGNSQNNPTSTHQTLSNCNWKAKWNLLQPVCGPIYFYFVFPRPRQLQTDWGSMQGTLIKCSVQPITARHGSCQLWLKYVIFVPRSERERGAGIFICTHTSIKIFGLYLKKFNLRKNVLYVQYDWCG